jgi:hypothetical protein
MFLHQPRNRHDPTLTQANVAKERMGFLAKFSWVELTAFLSSLLRLVI